MPFFLAAVLVINIILTFTSGFFILLLVGQLFFYGIGVYGWFTQSLNGVLKIPMFFMVVNTAIGVAWWQYFMGRRVVLWTPSER